MLTKDELIRGRKDNDFSYWIEQTLIDEYDNFEAENPKLNEQINWNIPDICEQMEPGMESDKFHQELTTEIERLLGFLQENKD